MTRRAASVIGLAAALAAPLASGCGGSPATEARPATQREPLRACELLLLPEADPEGADGMRPYRTEVDQTVGDEFAKCVYATGELPPRIVSLEVRRFAAEKSARGAQRTAIDYLPSLAAEPLASVAALGDEAVWAGGKLGQLHVRDGSQRLIVTVETGEPAERRARAEAIARLALARLHAPPPPEPR